MKGLIYTHRTTRPTGRLISQFLPNSEVYSKIRTAKRFDYVFRYGNSKYIDNEPEIVINSIRAIKNCANKRLMLEIFIENNIPIPRLYQKIEEVSEKSLPLVARPNYHFQGRDFNIIEDLKEAYYYLQAGYIVQSFIKREKDEYRIYVFNNKIFETNIKRVSNQDYYDPYIRNFHNGWEIIPIKRSFVPVNLQAISKKAVKALGLIFGGVDICYTQDDKIFVYEVNSAVGLYERKVKKLANFIQEYLNDIKSNI